MPKAANAEDGRQETEDESDPSQHDPFAQGELSPETGQGLLEIYVSKFMPRFPFVHVSEKSVDDLHLTKPVLCLAIMAVTAFKSLALQRRLGRMLNGLILERMARGEFASLDLLQGLLVSLAWYETHLFASEQHLV